MAQTAEQRQASNREHKRKWKKANPDKVNAQARRRNQERYAAEPEYRETKKRTARSQYNIEQHRLRTYGLSHEQFVEMYSRQNGRCAACRDELMPGKSTHVDHDHQTGQIRGLLCRNCNVALGHLKDDPKRITALAEYAAQHHALGGDAK